MAAAVQSKAGRTCVAPC